MARTTNKPSSRDAQTRGSSKQLRWLQLPIDGDGNARIDAILDNADEALNIFVEMVGSGWSLTLKLTADGTGYSATAYHDGLGSGGERIGVSGFAATPDDAFATVLYKLECIARDPSLLTATTGGNRGRR